MQEPYHQPKGLEVFKGGIRCIPHSVISGVEEQEDRNQNFEAHEQAQGHWEDEPVDLLVK